MYLCFIVAEARNTACYDVIHLKNVLINLLANIWINKYLPLNKNLNFKL